MSLSQGIIEELQNCEAFLFDKDGTLIDFNYLWLRWSVAAARFISGRVEPLDEADILRQWGVDAGTGVIDPEGPMAVGSLDDIIVSVAGLVYRHNSLWPEARQMVVDAVQHSYETVPKERYTRAIEGVPATIRRLRELKKRLAVVTTDETESAVRDIELLGLDDCFDVILGCDRVERCKPFPDLVIEACRRLEVEPANAVVIGDTRADMLMGKSAGVYSVVAVCSGVGKADKLAEDANMVLPGVAGLITR